MSGPFKCEICGESFSSRKGLHSHVSKKHKVLLADYYEKHFPRYCWNSKEQIIFKEYNDYMHTYFKDDDNMYQWITANIKKNKEDVKNWVFERFKNRVECKNLLYGPSFNELDTISQIPNTKVFRYLFGSYREVCERLGIEPLLFDDIEVEKVELPTDYQILIDTREQQPISFKNSKSQKLAFGDYTLAGEHYTSTYIDRKSTGDFLSTMTQGFDRFCREMDKCVSTDSYMYVVIEDSIQNIKSKNTFRPVPAKLGFVFRRMREIQHKFPRKIQFIFSGSRYNSQRLYPWLLFYGERLWGIDVQDLLIRKGFFNVRKRQAKLQASG